MSSVINYLLLSLAFYSFFKLNNGITTHISILEGNFKDIQPTTTGYQSNSSCPNHIGTPCPRYYMNIFPDYVDGSSTHLPITLQLQMLQNIIIYGNRVLNDVPPSKLSLNSVFTGRAGIALGFLSMAANTPKNISKYELLGISGAYIDATLNSVKNDGNQTCYFIDDIKLHKPYSDTMKYNCTSFLRGKVGIQAVAAVIRATEGDKTSSQQLVQQVQDLITKVGSGLNATTPGYYNEVVDTGRAGLLYTAYFLQHSLGPLYNNKPIITTKSLEALANAIITTGTFYGNSSFPLQWPGDYPYFTQYFLGQGEGVTGVLQMLLDPLCPIDVKTGTTSSLIRGTLDALVREQLASGNMPSTPAEHEHSNDTLVQWCHGAPGLVPLMLRAYDVYNDKAYLQSALNAGEVMWTRGLLTKGLMLGHGISGNTYMTLQLYQATNNPKYLYRAIKMQEFVLNSPMVSRVGLMRVPTPFPVEYSYWAGSLMGASVLWADMLKNPSAANMIGFMGGIDVSNIQY